MSDFTEGSHKRDRHRRHRGNGNKAGGAVKGTGSSGGTGGSGGDNRSAKGPSSRGDPTRDVRREASPRQESLRREASPRQESLRGVASHRDGDGRRDINGRRESEGRRPAEARRERHEDLPPLPKLPTPTCPRCGQPIQDITSALADRDSGEAVHFDCVLAFLQGAENLSPSEKLVYIGHGRFAVMTFENPADTRKFKIVRTIEWENRDTKAEWRDDISGRFSQVK